MIASGTIALDTNVLLRYLLPDDPEQGELASRLVARAIENRRPIHITLPVLCETVWTLTSAFGMAKADSVETVRRLLTEARSGRRIFAFQEEATVGAALEDYANGRAGFVDYLIGRLAHEAGAVTTYTFDREAAKAPTFKLLRRHGR